VPAAVAAAFMNDNEGFFLRAIDSGTPFLIHAFVTVAAAAACLKAAHPMRALQAPPACAASMPEHKKSPDMLLFQGLVWGGNSPA